MAAKCDIFTYSSATDVSEVTLSNVDATSIDDVSIAITSGAPVDFAGKLNLAHDYRSASISGGKIVFNEQISAVTRIVVIQKG